MKKCNMCLAVSPNDSKFCVKCGFELSNKNRSKEETKTMKATNMLSSLSLILFLVALIGFDGIIASVLISFGLNVKIAFIISSILYVLVILMGGYNIYYVSKNQKSNKRAMTVSISQMLLSVFVLLANFQKILMR